MSPFGSAAKKAFLIAGLFLAISIGFVFLARASTLSPSLMLEWLLVLALFSILAAIAVMALRKASAGRRLRRGQTPLNPREQQVLELLSEGLSNREIGLSLHISESTVKKHVTSTFRKLGARRRTEAARIARESGLVSD